MSEETEIVRQDAVPDGPRKAPPPAADHDGRRLFPGDYVGYEDRRYRIERKLGEGGMGTVYKAISVRDSGPVAIKVPRNVFLDRDMENYRLRHEYDRARNVPSVAHAIDIFEAAPEKGLRHPFLVMKYIDGEPLREVLQRNPRPDLGTTLRIGLRMAEALAALHRQNVLHRDVKPGNIIIERESGNPWLTDFGISTVLGQTTLTPAVAGTLEYRAAELAASRTEPDRSNEPSSRSDVYSLGILLWEMLAGQHPARNRTERSLEAYHASEDKASPNDSGAEIDPDLDALVMRCLRPAPEARPTAAELAAELQKISDRLLTPRSRPVDPPSPGDSAPPLEAQPPRTLKEPAPRPIPAEPPPPQRAFDGAGMALLSVASIGLLPAPVACRDLRRHMAGGQDRLARCEAAIARRTSRPEQRETARRFVENATRSPETRTVLLTSVLAGAALATIVPALTLDISGSMAAAILGAALIVHHIALSAAAFTVLGMLHRHARSEAELCRAAGAIAKDRTSIRDQIEQRARQQAGLLFGVSLVPVLGPLIGLPVLLGSAFAEHVADERTLYARRV